jgi:hypothetical protein
MWWAFAGMSIIVIQSTVRALEINFLRQPCNQIWRLLGRIVVFSQRSIGSVRWTGWASLAGVCSSIDGRKRVYCGHLISTGNLIAGFKSLLSGGRSERLDEGKKAKRKGL